MLSFIAFNFRNCLWFDSIFWHSPWDVLCYGYISKQISAIAADWLTEEASAEASAPTRHVLLDIFLQNKFSLVSWAKFPHHKHGMKLSKGAAVGSNPYVPVRWLTTEDSSALSERNQTELLCQSDQHVVTGFGWGLASEVLCCCKPKHPCRHRSAGL